MFAKQTLHAKLRFVLHGGFAAASCERKRVLHFYFGVYRSPRALALGNAADRCRWQIKGGRIGAAVKIFRRSKP